MARSWRRHAGDALARIGARLATAECSRRYRSHHRHRRRLTRRAGTGSTKPRSGSSGQGWRFVQEEIREPTWRCTTRVACCTAIEVGSRTRRPSLVTGADPRDACRRARAHSRPARAHHADAGPDGRAARCPRPRSTASTSRIETAPRCGSRRRRSASPREPGGSDRAARAGPRSGRARRSDPAIHYYSGRGRSGTFPRHRTPHAAFFLSEIHDVRASEFATAQGEPAPVLDELSAAKLRVVRYLPSNLKGPEIAAELFVSANTVRTHLRHIYAKLGAHGRAEAVGRARELGLLAPSHRRRQRWTHEETAAARRSMRRRWAPLQSRKVSDDGSHGALSSCGTAGVALARPPGSGSPPQT
jgi:DNA-binding CsgD family transcriptional regulator